MKIALKISEDYKHTNKLYSWVPIQNCLNLEKEERDTRDPPQKAMIGVKKVLQVWFRMGCCSKKLTFILCQVWRKCTCISYFCYLIEYSFHSIRTSRGNFGWKRWQKKQAVVILIDSILRFLSLIRNIMFSVFRGNKKRGSKTWIPLECVSMDSDANTFWLVTCGHWRPGDESWRLSV
jgi:hypothetical protein